jgi:hypothetical protein
MVKKSAILVFILCAAVFAQVGLGGLPGAFLDDGVGARSIGLGKTFVGLATGGEAVYYNPAGLVQLYTNDLTIMGATLYGGAKQSFATYVIPTKYYGAFAFSHCGAYATLAEDDNRDENNMKPADAMNYAWGQNGIFLSYSKDIIPAINVGINYKVIYSPIGNYPTNVSHGFDLGFLFFPLKSVSFGLVAKNLLQPRLSYDEIKDNPFPRTFKVGISAKLLENTLILLSDLGYTISESTKVVKFYEGLEYRPAKNLAARLGLNTNEFTLGAGIDRDMKRFMVRLDYAFLMHWGSSFMLEPTHKVSLTFNFGGFKTWIEAKPDVFSPMEKIVWLYVHIGAKREIERWQLAIKNSLGETVRTFGAFGEPTLTLSWDGRDDYGAIVPDDKYSYDLLLIEKPKTSRTYTGFLVTVKSKL